MVLGDRWGVTDAEVARRYPCDDVVPAPVLQVWRGVTVRATPELVWPWVTQLRLAPYSYDWIDNLGRRSPQELQPADRTRGRTALHDRRRTAPFGRVSVRPAPAEPAHGVDRGHGHVVRARGRRQTRPACC